MDSLDLDKINSVLDAVDEEMAAGQIVLDDMIEEKENNE